MCYYCYDDFAAPLPGGSEVAQADLEAEDPHEEALDRFNQYAPPQDSASPKQGWSWGTGMIGDQRCPPDYLTLAAVFGETSIYIYTHTLLHGYVCMYI